MRKYVLFMVSAWLLNACSHADGDADAAVKERARQFAEAYFNYDFISARSLATPESEKWLRFAASNVTQEDVDLINATSKSTSIAVTDCHRLDDTTTCVRVIVYNAVLKDTIGRPAHVASEADFALTLVNREGTYLVRMEGLPSQRALSVAKKKTVFFNLVSIYPETRFVHRIATMLRNGNEQPRGDDRCNHLCTCNRYMSCGDVHRRMSVHFPTETLEHGYKRYPVFHALNQSR